MLPPRRQFAMLAAAIAALLVAALWLAWAEYREAHFGEDHLAAAGEMRTLSQRLAKSALRSLRGDPDAFPLVQASRDGFAAALARLARDGRAPKAVQALATEWERSERNATTLLRDQKLLTALAGAAAGMERANPQLLERAERVQNLKLARGAPPAESAAASRLVLLTQRMARGAQMLLAADVVDPEVEFLLGKDVNEFRGTLARLREGAKQADLAAALAELAETFGLYQDSVVAVLGTRARLAGAKEAAFAIHADSERLLEVGGPRGGGLSRRAGFARLRVRPGRSGARAVRCARPAGALLPARRAAPARGHRAPACGDAPLPRARPGGGRATAPRARSARRGRSHGARHRGERDHLPGGGHPQRRAGSPAPAGGAHRGGGRAREGRRRRRAGRRPMSCSPPRSGSPSASRAQARARSAWRAW